MSTYRRRLMLASSGGTILPPGYAQIPYIECNGDSYIDTGIVYSSANSYTIDTNMLQDASMLVWADGNLSLNLNDISAGVKINIKQEMAANGVCNIFVDNVLVSTVDIGTAGEGAHYMLGEIGKI